MKDIQMFIELQKFGLTHSEILSVREDERQVLLDALIECDEQEVPYVYILENYVKDYRKYSSFEEFLRPKRF